MTKALVVAVCCVTTLWTIRSQSSPPATTQEKNADGSPFVTTAPEIVIPVTDLSRSQAFYQQIMKADVFKSGTTYVMLKVGAAFVRLVKADGVIPSNYPAVVWEVEDARPIVERFHAARIECIRPSAIAGKYAFLETCGIAQGSYKGGLFFKDPDGMILAIISSGK